MHEMGIAMQVVKIAADSVPEHIQNPRVEQVNLKIGKLSSVVPDSLRFCFEVITKDTPLEGATLHIEVAPVVARCRDCGIQWTIEDAVFRCKACNSGSVEVISGRELDIISIEIAD
ncbi:MAG: hydrogenase maturation nickel metallochaperone HypA [Thermodesulfobacteriota bacterium]